ncbi:hypothetical protein ACM26V_09690 [Salipaludibacillus sp. HK11]|uniref:hypothetical protein n=1 Tax=Salipaludibacillus sp. HK11 TaxID=3394320 RepID=UPI0039FD2DE5
MKYKNIVSRLLLVVAFIIFIVTVISGFIVQTDDFGEGISFGWGVIIAYWFSGFAIGIFFLALAEIIEQLNRLNKKANFQIGRKEKAFISGESDVQEESNYADDHKDSDATTSSVKDHAVSWIVSIGLLVFVFLLVIIGQM